MFQAASRLVLLEVLVTDRRSGKPVTGLSRGDFEILDGGQARSIAVFDAERVALDAMMVLDLSARVGDRGLLGAASHREFHEALAQAIRHLGEMDRLGAATMTADSAAVLAPLGYDKMGAADAIRSVLSGPVPHARVRPPLLYEALQLAADQFHGPPEPGRRRIIVVWTHNQAKPDEAMRKAVVARLQDASVTVAGIVCPVRRLRSAAARPKDPPLPGPRYPPAPRLPLPDPEMRPEIVEEAETRALDPIADGTGGRIVRSAALDSVDWHEFLGRERWRYRLGFYAPPDLPGGSERPLEVRLAGPAARKCPDCAVRARSSYRVP